MCPSQRGAHSFSPRSGRNREVFATLNTMDVITIAWVAGGVLLSVPLVHKFTNPPLKWRRLLSVFAVEIVLGGFGFGTLQAMEQDIEQQPIVDSHFEALVRPAGDPVWRPHE